MEKGAESPLRINKGLKMKKGRFERYLAHIKVTPQIAFFANAPSSHKNQINIRKQGKYLSRPEYPPIVFCAEGHVTWLGQ